MREDASSSTFAITAGLFLFFAVMVNALVGTSQIGIHEDCLDGLDNDGDSFTDFGDNDCAIYPYADGNGEEFTPEQDRMNGEAYIHGNAFDAYLIYWMEYNGVDPCNGFLGFSPVTQENAFNAESEYTNSVCFP